MFRNCHTTTDQGNIGEAAAIMFFTNIGGIVCKPLFINSEYDFIVDINNELCRVQVKTTKQTNRPIDEDNRAYMVNLKSSGCNARKHTYTPIDVKKIDLLFVLADDGTKWVIPASKLTAKSGLTLNESYDQFKV